MKNGLEIVPVSRMDEVLKHALIRQPEPVEWDEEAEPLAPRKGDEDPATVVAH